MFYQALTITLRILLFRAGPQDFPYSATLTRVIVPLAIVAAYLQYRLNLPPVSALLHAVASVAVLAGFTQVMLQMRKFGNRLQQTVNSLYASNAALTLVLLAPLAAIAPHMARIAQNPDLARTEPLPGGPAMIVIVVSLWHFFVTAHIYRHALSTHFSVGALVALISAILTVSLAGLISALLA